MNRNLSKFSGLIYAATICVMLLSALVLYRNVRTRTAALERVSHAQDVLLQLEEIDSLIKDAETGQRGYLLTGDKEYLNPYTRAQAGIDPALSRLEALIRDNPGQQARIPQLRGVIDARLAELAETVALYDEGKHTEALQIVHSNLGREVMNQVNEQIHAVRQEESRQLQLRQNAWIRATRNLFLAIALSTGANLFLLFVIAAMNRQRIAAERSTAEELAIREQRFRTTLASIGDAVITTDQQERVTFVNPTAENVLGLTLAQCIGRPLAEVFPIYNEDTGAPAENPVMRVIAEAKVTGLANHTILKRRDGAQIPIEDSAAPIRDDSGRVCGVVLVFRDVTRERDAQEALRRADRMMVAARMAATVAHEINNPLEAVFNLLYLSSTDPSTSGQVRHHLEQATQELNRMAHITRQTLRFHRTSPGMAEVDVGALVDDLLELWGPRFSSCGIKIIRQYQPGSRLVTSPDDLKQILSNLLTNAGDAMANGGELAIVVTSASVDGESRLRIVVEDTGYGVAPENVNRIFEPFFTTKPDVGTGLGLWVVKQLVQKHGGSVSLQSPAKGKSGARFQVELPLVSAARAASNSSAAD